MFNFELKDGEPQPIIRKGKEMLVVVTIQCPNCGKKNAKMMGRCKLCFKEVCQHCGNLEFIQGQEVPVHNQCFVEKFALIAPAFKFIKPKTK